MCRKEDDFFVRYCAGARDLRVYCHGCDVTHDTPTVTCSSCGRTWDLEYELDELQVGNRALETFAMDHHRHTGHYPDDVTPWLVDCRRCPEREPYLSERPARRFAEAHARHTGHEITLKPPEQEDEVVDPETVR